MDEKPPIFPSEMDEKPTSKEANGICKPDAELLSCSDTTTTATTSDDPKQIKNREVWARKIDFLLACIGFSVGLGNVWRFPFLCYRNGGGAFLIPYFIAVVLGGLPVFFLEVSLGQFMSEGGIGAWKICPLFQGIGYACAIIVFLLNCDYNIILTWAFYYLFSSFTMELPWSHCRNEWNTPSCKRIVRGGTNANETTGNQTSLVSNFTMGQNFSLLNSTSNMFNYVVDNFTSSANQTIVGKTTDPVTEFWERRVLQLSGGIEETGSIKWDLALCLLLAWIVVYFCIWKGIKSSGKVMYFTATSPYILMFVLLIRGLTLDGAMEGVKYYLLPEWEKLLVPQVWVDAGTQIFFSYSISLGTLTALGSYNKFRHNSFRDSIIFSGVNSFTSLLAGLVIFSILGFMAKQQNVSVAEVAESGPGLAFIAYPEAVSQMPVAPLWSALFFVMVILLGLDSQFVGVEGFVTAVVDLYPTYLRRGYRREILIGSVCALSFFIGLSMVTNGGMYVFQLFDYYSASRIVLVVAFAECVVVSAIYGIDRFYDNMEMMYGFPLPNWSKVFWVAITPLFTMGIFILGAISYSELEYKRKTVTYQYPNWAIVIGWMLALCSVVWIPITIVFRLLMSKGPLSKRVTDSIKPHLKSHQLRPGEDMNAVKLIYDDPSDDWMDADTSPNSDYTLPVYNMTSLLNSNGDIVKESKIENTPE